MSKIYKRLNVFIGPIYVCSTVQARTCKEARQRFLARNPDVNPKLVKVKRDNKWVF